MTRNVRIEFGDTGDSETYGPFDTDQDVDDFITFVEPFLASRNPIFHIDTLQRPGNLRIAARSYLNEAGVEHG